MVEAISEIRPMVPPISLIAVTDSWVADCMPVICELISLVALAVWPASGLTSCATGSFRQVGDAAAGVWRLRDRLAGDLVGLLHLTADLGDRGHHFLGRAGDRLDIGGGLLGGGRHDAAEALGVFRGPAHGGRRRFHLG